MKLIPFNINNNVKVRIKDEGYEYMAKRHNELVGHIPSMGLHTADYYRNKADEEGYTKMQMHVFMELFGAFCCGSFIVPFETNILIEITE